MGKYAHLFGTDIKWNGLLAETVHAVLPIVAAYQQPELSRAELRDTIIPAMARRVEAGVPLYRDGYPLPGLQEIWSLAHDLQSMAALVQWASMKEGDPAECVKWH